MTALDQLAGRAHQAARVHAIVVLEVIVFGRQQSVDEAGGNVGETDGRAAHFAKLCNQFAVAAEHAQRDLQLNIAQGIDRGQVRGQVEKGAAQAEQQPADDRDDGPPDELQQAYQGFWISRKKNELDAGIYK